VTHDEVIAALGPIDDIFVAQIIETGANSHELAEARAWLANNEPLMNEGKPLAAGRIAHLVEILATIEEDEEEPGPEIM
jgi:uncharacterized membrane protein YkvA (DUF1232 family)